jgi:hypothetical protein
VHPLAGALLQFLFCVFIFVFSIGSDCVWFDLSLQWQGIKSARPGQAPVSTLKGAINQALVSAWQVNDIRHGFAFCLFRPRKPRKIDKPRVAVAKPCRDLPCFAWPRLLVSAIALCLLTGSRFPRLVDFLKTQG